MPRGSLPCPEANAGAVSVGQIVMATNRLEQWEDGHKEPASVVKLGCKYEDDQGEEYLDGVMVKFQVGNIRAIVPYSDVSPLKDDNGVKGRRSTRQQQSPKTIDKVDSSRPNRRAVVTPSPTLASAVMYTEKVASSLGDDEERVEETPAATKKRGRSAEARGNISKKRAVSDGKKRAKALSKKGEDNEAATESPYFARKNKKVSDRDDDSTIGAESDGDGSTVEEVITSKAKTLSTKKGVPTKKAGAKKAVSAVQKRATGVTKKPAARSRDNGSSENKPKPISKEEVIIIDENEDDDVAFESDDDDDDDDKPYMAEYAATGRATCRRCDEVIAKDSLRVGHTPLFRGKPGFKVYRHLDCMVFDEAIQKVEDIGGWKSIRKRSKADFERLALRVEESKLEWQMEQEELQPDELVQVNFEGEIRQSPKGLAATLLPFQVEGVSWMYHQEVKIPELHGGILADEMGMGKTLQTIATILDNRPMLQHSKPGAKHPPSLKGYELEARIRESKLWDTRSGEWTHEMNMNGVPKKMWPKKGTARAGTLVVCPVIALNQWKQELEKFTLPGTVTVAIYHGPNRAKEFPMDKLTKYDIILTTYQVLEQDFRKMVSPNKVTCPNCGAKFKIDKLRVHLKYFCGEGAQKTEAQARQQRTRDLDNRRGSERNSLGGKGKGKGSETKTISKTATKSAAAKKATTKKKPASEKKPKKSMKVVVKRRKPKRTDSSDDVSDEDAVVPGAPQSVGRPSRSAAMTASRRLSASMHEWTSGGGGMDDESFGGQSSESEDDDDSAGSYDEEDSDGEAIPSKKPSLTTRKRKPPRKKAKKAADSSDSDDDGENSDSDSSADNAALARARRRQKEALEQATKKKGGKKTAVKIKRVVKGTQTKKKVDESSDENDEGENEVNEDPLEGVDLKELMKEAMEGSRMSALHSICWWRVVLDEAHFIKSRSSQTAAAAFALTGIHRWALSGTPLQNRVGELYSLIRFLRIDPMAHYFCRQKDCNCKSIHYRIKHGVCQDCGHRGFQHFSHFNKHVLNPIQNYGYSGDGRRAMFKLKNEVLDKCLLRRTKETRAEDMCLPPRIVSIRTIQLHPVEKDFYDALYTQTKSSFSDYVEQGTLLNNYAHIFDLLTRMRQAVDHPYLIVYSKRNCEQAAASANAGSLPQIANGSTDCDLCQEPPTERIVSSCCGSAFCRACVVEYVTLGVEEGETPCPSCRAPFTIDLNQAVQGDRTENTASESDSDRLRSISVKNTSNSTSELGPSLKELPHVQTGSILRRIDLSSFATSTKIEALVQELVEMRKTNPGCKALVFSQFVNMLDLIRWRIHSDPGLADMGLGARILHGGMDVKSRDKAISDFKEDDKVRVLLMSLKAGGVALNLTVASWVFLVDNWWNPAAEMQAIDRTHRLGQHRCIRAVRFIAEGTVEERVLQLQEKKRLVFDGTVGRDAGSLKMLTVDDMHSLFQ